MILLEWIQEIEELLLEELLKEELPKEEITGFYDGVNTYGDFQIDLATIAAGAPDDLGAVAALLPSGVAGAFHTFWLFRKFFC